jgi:hydroxymethylpyrimidine pyrophosphatase-like HAD family hydrolase
VQRIWYPKKEIIAIGDNYNDSNMIEFAGLGIAMGNTPIQIKEIADDITLSNDKDGVAEALKKYILS